VPLPAPKTCDAIVAALNIPPHGRANLCHVINNISERCLGVVKSLARGVEQMWLGGTVEQHHLGSWPGKSGVGSPGAGEAHAPNSYPLSPHGDKLGEDITELEIVTSQQMVPRDQSGAS